MKKRFELRWPKHGISDDQAHEKQYPLTTPHAKNVRTLDPGSGRSQGAQRAGYSNFSSSALNPGRKVDALASVAVDLPKIQFFGPSNATLKEKWSYLTPSQYRALDVTTDFDGNVYVVDSSGVFLLLGPGGEEEARQTFYVGSTEEVVARIAVDEDRAVYVATTHPYGYTSRIIRFNRVEFDEDDKVHFAEAWTYSSLNGIRDFRVGGGVLAVSRFLSPQSEQDLRADLLRLGQLNASEPTALDISPTPWPISAIALNEHGEVLGTAPTNPLRSSILGDEGWYASVDSWSPHELEGPDGYGAARRLHYWLDAQTLGDALVDAAKVDLWPDRRWLHSSLNLSDTDELDVGDGVLSGGGDVEYSPPTDRVGRPGRSGVVQQGLLANPSYWVPPQYRAMEAGALPVVRFTSQDIIGAFPSTDSFPWPFTHGTQGVVAITNRSFMSSGGLLTSSGVKGDTDADGDPNDDGRMPNQLTVFPAHKRAVFSTFMLIRYVSSDDGPSLVFHQMCLGGLQFALVVNAKEDDVYTDSLASQRGYLTLYVGDKLGTSLAGDSAGVSGHKIVACNLEEADFDNPQRIALVCIHNAGANVPGGPQDGSNGNSMFRVNGRTVDTWTLQDDSFWYAGSYFGGTAPYNNVATSGQFYYGGPFRGWSGDLLEVITILGRTASPGSGAPNEVPVEFPGEPSGAGAPAAGGATEQWTDMDVQRLALPGTPYADLEAWYNDDPQLYTENASEVERIEGWLAYRWGCPNILASGLPTIPGTSANFQDVHPFGLGAVTGDTADLVPPVGSPNAGGEVIGDTGRALLSPDEILFKLGSSGKVQWAISGGGHGLGVVAGPDQSVYAVGAKAEGSNVVAKRLLDLGPTLVETGDGTWELEDPETAPPLPVLGLAADDAGNLYWPRAAAQNEVQLQVNGGLGSSGATELTITKTAGGSEFYTFHTPSLTFGSSQVNNGLGDAQAGLVNLAAAINANGTFDVAYSPQYAGAAAGPPPVNRTQHPDVIASVAGTAAAPILVLKPRVGATQFGKLTITISGHAPGLEFVHDTAAAVAELREGRVNRLEVRGPESGGLLWVREYGGSLDDERPLAVALNPKTPFYDDEDKDGTAEHLYVAFQNNSQLADKDLTDEREPTLRKYAQIERRQVIGANKSPRRTVHVATCGGDFFVIAKGKSGRLVNNGRRAFNADSPFAKLFAYRSKVYGLDGQSYVKFNPKTLLLEEWKAEGAGEIPFGARLGCVWNGRIVLARTPDEPHNIHMSERGNPDGWDTSPTTITPLTAFSGSGSGNLHFAKHDLVNALIPARDDLLFIGGDQSISRLTGDPGGQGQLDNITTSEGIAFGDAYAIAPEGTIYVKGIQGGVWRLGLDGSADRISLRWIERRLQDIDLKGYDVRMAWNFRREGLHVFQVPKGLGGRLVTHWFWDAKEDGWWEDEFSVTGLQPTSVAIFDGDEPDDRRLVIGCEDGFVRFEDEGAKSDAGYRIESEIVFGPLVPGSAGARGRFSHLEPTLASSGDGAELEVFTDSVSDVVAGRDADFRGWAEPGFGGYLLFQATGNQVWVKLRNAAVGERWSLESLFLRARAAGRRRIG